MNFKYFAVKTCFNHTLFVLLQEMFFARDFGNSLFFILHTKKFDYTLPLPNILLKIESDSFILSCSTSLDLEVRQSKKTRRYTGIMFFTKCFTRFNNDISEVHTVYIRFHVCSVPKETELLRSTQSRTKGILKNVGR